LDRYAAWHADSAPVAPDPHRGTGRAKRAETTLATSRGSPRDIKAGARDWLTLVGNRQALTTFGAAPGEHNSTVLGRHPDAESMSLLSPAGIGLKSPFTFHNRFCALSN
jgi:hypothetical protein